MELPHLRRRQLPPFQFRVLVIGRASAGKTTILQRVCGTSKNPTVRQKERSNAQNAGNDVLKPSHEVRTSLHPSKRNADERLLRTYSVVSIISRMSYYSKTTLGSFSTILKALNVGRMGSSKSFKTLFGISQPPRNCIKGCMLSGRFAHLQ
jgi:GTPase SAR1 family protein